MGKKLYVGNLSYSVRDSDLEDMFAAHGSVQSAQVIMDRDTGRSKGFGFVEMGSDQEARAAITAMNGKRLEGRALTVNEARPREEGGGGGRGGGGGGRLRWRRRPWGWRWRLRRRWWPPVLVTSQPAELGVTHPPTATLRMADESAPPR